MLENFELTFQDVKVNFGLFVFGCNFDFFLEARSFLSNNNNKFFLGSVGKIKCWS